jgi:hypothetical protein
MENGNITGSYVTAKVSSEGFYSLAGGLAGEFSENSTMERCYAWAIVDAQGDGVVNAGGIAGSTTTLSSPLPLISTCYALGTVTIGGTASDSNKDGGGIVGSYSGIIENCAVLNISIDVAGLTNADEVAGIKGAISASSYIQNNYSADDITIISTGSGYWAADASYPRTDFMGPVPGTVYGFGYLNWDFTAIGDWHFISGYPYPVLSWQDSPPPDPATIP